ncbi:putative ribosomal protein arginine N-methytransferase rmt3 [Trichodelitschia bisporula]|uniref:type I protein arginine methyltransferase n=1 Tax=Trichodelitschia bisporula TaxID=703511 RepID=A0A6G1I6C6_9PEZI|nr:putative ribosomal protein arginine N-methytransferase rmt3 [Trichodelitschia bisporula]
MSSDSSSSSGSERLDLTEDHDWQDVESDREDVRFVSLFDEATFPDAEAMIDYCKQKYNFDFRALKQQLDLDFYSGIKLVNYIRSEVKCGNKSPDVSSKSLFEDDKYLQPVLEDDALLFSLDDLLEGISGSTNVMASGKDQDLAAKVAILEEKLRASELQFSGYRQRVEETLEKQWSEREGNAGASVNSNAATGDKSTEKSDREQGYFDSYSYNEIHEIMLKDTVRTDAYRDFIYDNKDLFAGKTVLDVGCGTGILSMFCARAGAAKVFAVDNSGVIGKARINVVANGLADTITCIRGKVEEITLPVKQVDIIVSEWMGYGLLYEAMLDSVIWARDHYLAPEGLMVPSDCTLRIAPVTDEEYIQDNIEFWYDVYGFDMKAMTEKIYEDVLVRQAESKNLAADSTIFLHLPLHTITTAELSFVKPFSVETSRDIDSLDGWAIWFDTFFQRSRTAQLPATSRAETWKEEDRGIAFTTGPAGKETHWRSCIMLVDQSKRRGSPVTKGTKLEGTVQYSKGKEHPRELDIEICWRTGDASGPHSQIWLLR